ncbi:sensor histidine kinase [Streptomyces iranensis]|uniref:histidine kinase n=1 Tax=Streptomyces iranensis TaxID=576784 RepID=A0A060ZEF8_9ACTN|nr:HAMP domain-containing sensor histidine kinase [Streptomyces iranensis]MBP2061924.1 signal transduction histidine kinase [Streptomyces iranensis]CDR03734.1 integral membrane sensor signal transductionhistidine kinase [Streptomyces iranensis]
MTLRWRIVALVAAATCAAAAAVGVLVHHASRDRELSQARDGARTTLDRAAVIYARTGAVQGSGAVLDAPGLPGDLRRLVEKGHQGTEFTTGPGGPAMWAARPADDQVLSVRLDVSTAMRDIGALDTNIILAGLMTTAVVLPLGVLTAERMSRRLRLAAATARRIAAGDLDARISPAARPHDEIAEISGAVDSMAAALQERLLDEQRFTADVAHELRTPLMGLVTAAELLPPGEAAGYVRDRVRVLSTLVEELLEISRLDAGAEEADLSPCPLGPVLEEAIAGTGLSARLRTGAAEDTGQEDTGQQNTGQQDGEDTRQQDVTDGPKVWTDPRRLTRIVANLVVNAHRHGREPVEVTVAADGRTVTVRDHGTGFPDDLLEKGPQRFRTGVRERGRGHGLGLTIAVGQAQVIGATLEFGNAPDGGAVATLRLPEQPERPEPGPIHG